MARDSDDLVFSTDGSHRETCPRCRRRPCVCPAETAIDPAQTVVRLRLETKGRGGKAVTVLYDLPPNAAFWADVLKRLKAHCGTGGAAKEGRLEIQGDQRTRVTAWLSAQGFRVKGGGQP